MKNILKFAFAGAILFGMASCEDDEQNTTDFVQESVTRGAVLRTLDLQNDLPLTAAGAEVASFSVSLEEQDAFEGDLLESVDVYVTFKDNTEGPESDTTGAITDEVFIENVGAAAFTDGPFGLPRTELTYSFDELRALTNIASEDQLTGGDTFTIRLALNLTDGRVFSADNAGGVITGGFFSSPFQYVATVSCPVPADYFVGDYLLEKTSTQSSAFGEAWGTEVVTVEGTGAVRGFDFTYFPGAFDFGQRLTIMMNCGEFIVSGTSLAGTLGCDGTTIEQAQGDVTPSPYSQLFEPGDDDVIEISFEDFNGDAGCGTGSYVVTLQLTKQ